MTNVTKLPAALAEIEIQKNIPAPRKQGRFSIFPMDKMEVGDSFFSADPKARAAAYDYSQRHPGMKFTVRSVAESGMDGCRIWRIA